MLLIILILVKNGMERSQDGLSKSLENQGWDNQSLTVI